jgi:hypothetical protein
LIHLKMDVLAEVEKVVDELSTATASIVARSPVDALPLLMACCQGAGYGSTPEIFQAFSGIQCGLQPSGLGPEPAPGIASIILVRLRGGALRFLAARTGRWRNSLAGCSLRGEGL